MRTKNSEKVKNSIFHCPKAASELDREKPVQNFMREGNLGSIIFQARQMHAELGNPNQINLSYFPLLVAMRNAVKLFKTLDIRQPIIHLSLSIENFGYCQTTLYMLKLVGSASKLSR